LHRLPQRQPNRLSGLICVYPGKSPRVSLLTLAIAGCHPTEKLERLGLEAIGQARIGQPYRRYLRCQVKPHCQVRLANQIGLQTLSRLHLLL
jgi:hypothetical protein